MGVDAGADGGGAHVDLVDQQHRLAQPLLVLAQHHRIGAEFLAERHRHRILQLGAAHLQHVLEFLRFLLERPPQHRHCIDQRDNPDMRRQLQRRGVHIVGTLAHVDVFVRVQEFVFAALVAENFQRPVGDHLVGVHVGGGAGAALDHIHDELVGQRAGADFLAGGDNGVGPGLVEQAERVVGLRRRTLDGSQRVQQLGVDGDRGSRDREVLDRAQGVDTVIGGCRHILFAEQIVFTSCRRKGHARAPLARASPARFRPASDHDAFGLLHPNA